MVTVKGTGRFGHWAVVALVSALLLAGPHTVVAREPRAFPFPVSIVVCERDPGPNVFSAAGVLALPRICSYAAGITVAVTTGDARPIGTCTTDVRGSCHVPVPYNSLVIVAEDVSTVPAGHVPRANPLMTWVYTEYAGAGFVNLPASVIADGVGHGNAALTIHSRACPPGYAGRDYYHACHATPPSYAQTIFVSGPEVRAARIDGEGNAGFADLMPGTYELRAGLPADTSNVVVFCAQASAPGVEIPSAATHRPSTPQNDYQTTVTLGPDDTILCDLYAIHHTAPKSGPASMPQRVLNHAA